MTFESKKAGLKNSFKSTCLRNKFSLHQTKIYFHLQILFTDKVSENM